MWKVCNVLFRYCSKYSQNIFQYKILFIIILFIVFFCNDNIFKIFHEENHNLKKNMYGFNTFMVVNFMWNKFWIQYNISYLEYNYFMKTILYMYFHSKLYKMQCQKTLFSSHPNHAPFEPNESKNSKKWHTSKTK